MNKLIKETQIEDNKEMGVWIVYDLEANRLIQEILAKNDFPYRFDPSLKKMKNKIILSAETKLIDTEAREILRQLIRKIEAINERTKRLTLDVRELNKKIKEK